jgi:hypothetical protein
MSRGACARGAAIVRFTQVTREWISNWELKFARPAAFSLESFVHGGRRRFVFVASHSVMPVGVPERIGCRRLSSLGERGRCAKVFSTLGLQSPVARARAIRPNNALQRTRASVVGLPGIPSCAKLISRAAEGERYTSEPVRLAPRINWLL